MAYRLKAGEPIGGEVRRIADKQLGRAVAELRDSSTRNGDKAIHAARRRVKKVRALGRLVQSGLGAEYELINKRLRAVARMLAPMTDGEAVVDTLTRLRKASGDELPQHTFSAIRTGLLRRKRRVAEKARAGRVLQAAARLLRIEQKSMRGWTLESGGFRVIAPGLRRSYRGARKAMRLAAAHPGTDNYHSWRRRVKDHWFHLRLLERRCNGQLLPDQRQLEVLDGYLGEYHNCAILQRIVMSEALDSRKETAHFLRLLRRYQRDLRHQAHALGAKLYEPKPRQFVARVRRLWQAAKRAPSPVEIQPSWPRTA